MAALARLLLPMSARRTTSCFARLFFHADSHATEHLPGRVVARDITPPIGIYHRMWGASDHARATGVHRPLVATALVLRRSNHSGKEPIAQPKNRAVGIDHCMFWGGEMQTLRARVAAQAGVDPARLCIALSHTHGVGLLGLERRHLPGGELIEPYLEELASRLAESVRGSSDRARTGHDVYGTGRCALATHRDLWDPNGEQYVSGYNPEGPRTTRCWWPALRTRRIAC